MQAKEIPPYQHRSLGRQSERIARARELRRVETESEATAWRLSRCLRLQGLDGAVHVQPSQSRRDSCRDRELRRMGYSVMRLPNGGCGRRRSCSSRKYWMWRGNYRMHSAANGERQPPHPARSGW
jgi:hypothetical protein